MADEKSGCPGLVDGFCIHHEGEMARRETDRTRITDLKEDILENKDDIGAMKKHIAQLFNFVGFSKGATLLISVIITGAYLYTYTHSVESSLHTETNTEDIKNVRGELHRIGTDIAIVQTNYASLGGQLEINNQRLEDLTKAINEERIQRARAEGGFNHPIKVNQ